MDPCSSNPCHNDAACAPSSNYRDFFCSCPLGFTGRLCNEDINECAKNNPCRNGGSCINTEGGYTCQCRHGYEGRDCLINTDDCASSPCQNGGTCLDGTGEFKCLCVDGFGGEHCEHDIDECASNPCQNGATCHDYVNSYTCVCRSGFSGTNCHTNDQDCTASSCLNGGTCIDGINGYTCICARGFSGSNCQSQLSQCDKSPCKNGGTCEDISLGGGHYRCHCPYGWTGSNCEQIVDWCKSSPCENNARCAQQGTSFHCDCPRGWTGKLCDVEQVPCERAAQNRGVSRSQLCKNGGHCKNSGNSHECICRPGFEGSYCQKDINECASNPCQNGAVCKDLIGTYRCECPTGFQGPNCEFNVNDCDPNPCHHNGICYDLVNGYKCACPHGTDGVHCERNLNDCFEGACHHGGKCIDKVGSYECQCKPGYVGPRCEGDVNECLTNPCSHQGTEECIQLINNYQCVCKLGWMGRNCDTKVNFCQSRPCQNGGVCTNHEDAYFCQCPKGYSGHNCEYFGQICDREPCQHGGTCISNSSGFDGYSCVCPPGTTGNHCEKDTRNECAYNPCKNGAQCIDRIGDFDCNCPSEFRGKNCEINDKSSPGGIDRTEGRYEIVDIAMEQRKCIQNNCEAKSGDYRCHEECNTHVCNYDGGDCRLGLNPWKFCNVTVRSRQRKSCRDVFQDGYCDEECNNKACLFDGRDCEEGGAQLQCDAHYDVYCSAHYADGKCDERCNNAACGWDGLDCIEHSKGKNTPHKIIPGSFYVVLTMSLEKFDTEIQKRFERYLSLVLRTNFHIKRNPDTGEPMIYEYNPSVNDIQDSQYAFNTNLMLQSNLGIIVYLAIDNAKCGNEADNDIFEENCFEDAEGYANLFGAMIGAEKLQDDWGIVEVGAGKNQDKKEGTQTWQIVTGIFVVVMILGVLGVVTTQNKRKRKSGITWFPEGWQHGHPLRQSGRKADNSQQMFDPANGKLNIGETWSDVDPYDPQPPISKKRRGDPYSSGQTVMTDFDDNDSDPRGDGEDSRQWTQKHLNAADPAFLQNPEILGAITPPSHHDQGDLLGLSSASLLNGNDVDVRGPMGTTPLMIAAFRGNGCGLDSGELDDDADDSSAAVIQDLISQGANLNQQMEKTSETPLHLAARHARADAAKTLLDAGADANAQDAQGRTPLHAAVASDAQGVFHILLKNRSTNLNATTTDGTTPLILAARLAIEGMVEQLIEAEADINFADELGKTALHWAASVNNVDAVNVLLQNGANRDAQDKKDETPLFLAAREGSYQAAKALLDHCANRDIQDHMDRLPIHVAQERMHQDIVTLLEQHIPPAPQHMAASSASIHPHHQQQQSMLSQQLHLSPQATHSMNILTASGNQQMMSAGANGTKQRQKKQRTKSLAQSPEENNLQSVNGGATLPRGGQAQQQRKQQQQQQQQSLKRKKLPPTPDQQAASNAAQMEMMLSPPEYHNNGQTNPLALSHPNLEDLMNGEGNGHNGNLVNKPPPRYEEAAAMARSMQALQGGMPGQQCLESQYSNFSSNQGQTHSVTGTHPRQQSMPSTMSTHLSPPHSNMSAHMSPPHTMSPPNMGSAMSPPQSVQSNHTMSPPHHHQMHMSPPPHGGQQQLSPIKNQQMNGRQQQLGSQQLPTSPTHIAAMRGATHQRHQQFDFNNVSSQQQFMYPTPPHSQGGQGVLMQNGATVVSDGMNYMTPSPDSPGQWSSASPQSHSDWSETGIHSPPSNNNCVGQTSLQQSHQNSFHLNQQKQHQQQLQHQQQQQQQQQMAQQQMLQQQTDGVLI